MLETLQLEGTGKWNKGALVCQQDVLVNDLVLLNTVGCKQLGYNKGMPPITIILWIYWLVG